MYVPFALSRVPHTKLPRSTTHAPTLISSEHHIQKCIKTSKHFTMRSDLLSFPQPSPNHAKATGNNIHPHQYIWTANGFSRHYPTVYRSNSYRRISGDLWPPPVRPGACAIHRRRAGGPSAYTYRTTPPCRRRPRTWPGAVWCLCTDCGGCHHTAAVEGQNRPSPGLRVKGTIPPCSKLFFIPKLHVKRFGTFHWSCWSLFPKKYCVTCKKSTLKVLINFGFVTSFEDSHYTLLFRYIYGARVIQWFCYSKYLHVNFCSCQWSMWSIATSLSPKCYSANVLLDFCTTADFEIKYFFNEGTAGVLGNT